MPQRGVVLISYTLVTTGDSIWGRMEIGALTLCLTLLLSLPLCSHSQAQRDLWKGRCPCPTRDPNPTSLAPTPCFCHKLAPLPRCRLSHKWHPAAEDACLQHRPQKCQLEFKSSLSQRERERARFTLLSQVLWVLCPFRLLSRTRWIHVSI